MLFLTLTTLFAFLFLLTGTIAAPFASAAMEVAAIEASVPADVLALAKATPDIEGFKAIPGAEGESLCKMVTIIHHGDGNFLSAYIFNYKNQLIGRNENVDTRIHPFYFYSQLTWPAVMYDLNMVPNFWYAGRHELMYCQVRGSWSCTQTFVC